MHRARVRFAYNPQAPPLDIRGEYDVVWFVAYIRPDGSPTDPDPSLPRGGCSGTVIMEQQGGTSFRGTIKIPGGVTPPCHAATLPLVARAERAYIENSYDYGWDLFVLSDVEPLLDCAYRTRPPGNTGTERGVGRINPQGRIHLALGNIYDCPSGRWWIVVGAAGQRRP